MFTFMKDILNQEFHGFYHTGAELRYYLTTSFKQELFIVCNQLEQ